MGFSFSPTYAEYLGLNPRASYLEILDSFKFQAVRLPVYWDRVYQNGSYDFAEIDFLVKEARKRNLAVVLSFGYRNFRWPECYAPQEFASLAYPEFEEKLLSFDREVLNHFNKGEISFWQVENEPYLHPHCRYLNVETLKKLVAQVREIHPEGKVVITYGGAQAVTLPFFWGLYEQADYLGASFYARILDPLFRKYYVETYRLGILSPRSIARERGLINGKGKGFWVVEFQAEPWKEDGRTMSPTLLKENWEDLISFGSAEKVFVWGAEWWLKEKTQGRPQMFQAAQSLFNGNLGIK